MNGDGDFFANEQSVVSPKKQKVTIELNGNVIKELDVEAQRGS